MSVMTLSIHFTLNVKFCRREIIQDAGF